MGCECRYEGTISLRTDVTVEQVIDLYAEHAVFDIDRETSSDGLWTWVTPEEGVELSFHDNQVRYNVDGYFTIHMPVAFEGFLEAMIPLAVGPWEDEVTETVYGPDPASIARHQVELALDRAQAQINEARRRLDEITAS